MQHASNDDNETPPPKKKERSKLPVFSTMCYVFDYELSLNMALSEPQYSLCCTIKETDSKAEQGNDNLIACGSNDDLTATENNSAKSVTIYDARRSSDCRSSSSCSSVIPEDNCSKS